MTFSCWEEAIPDIPPRSQLYSLPPLNLGSPFVESLTSYICRLASEHHVPLGTLVQYIIAPRIDKLYITTGQSRSISSFFRYAASINGNGLMANDWVQALEELTFRDDLSRLTLLAAGVNILSHRDLLQPVKQWCPACYDTWRLQGTTIYEPLLWFVNGVTVCPEHHRRLERCCPHCSSRPTLLSWSSSLGCCSDCGRWLGSSKGTDNVEQKDIYIAEIVGAFLAYISPPSPPILPESFIKSLQQIIAATTEGNIAAFSRYLGLPKTTIWEMVQGRFPPALPFLFHLSLQFRLSLCQLLVDFEELPVSISPEESTRRQKSRIPFNYAKVEQTLNETLADSVNNPLSMRAVARLLGYPPKTIATHFPKHCQKISHHYLAYRKQQGKSRKTILHQNIQDAVRLVHDQGLNLTFQNIGNVLGTPGSFREKEARDALLLAKSQLDNEIAN